MPGDRLLLCSDGLSDVVDPSEMKQVLAAGTREAAARELVELALAGGSRDNVTAVVADVVARRAADYAW